MPPNNTLHFKHKVIRDPPYGFITMSKTETDIMDTAAFRRLYRIRQLAHAHTVYPSAHHTRFEHSLGVMHIAGRMYDEIGTDTGLIRLSEFYI